MAITKQKRAEMESLIYNVFSALDDSGKNTQRYKEMFKAMSDEQFDKFFKNLFSNDDLYLTLDVVDFENPLKQPNVKKAANVLGIPLTERIIMPFINHDKDKPVVTRYECLTGYLHIKRLQQMLSKKNSTSTEIGTRSALTGQVTGIDKNARVSDLETFCLTTIGADNALKEFMGPRSDDKVMKTQMYSDISKKGYVSLGDLPNRTENKTSLNTVDTFLIGMGIKSDLVTTGLVVKKTLD